MKGDTDKSSKRPATDRSSPGWSEAQTLLEQIAQEQRQPSPELQAKQQRLLDLLHKPKH